MKQTLLILVLLATTLFGVPAMPGKLTFKQNDGSVFVGELKGDEYFYWIETEDGYIVKYNKNSKEYDQILETSKIISNIKTLKENLLKKVNIRPMVKKKKLTISLSIIKIITT
ncbi:MAG TPA: hypothetical protein EYO73_08680, partial [Sulfurimonas sp.]|nr:hypothetical protein [Sulfurimonas sp.]